jgi:hypothetical protein
LNRMQFGAYLFDQNPRRIELSRAHNLAAHTLPGTGVAMQDTGPRCRTARCEGEVFGDTADAALSRLAALAAACAPGLRATLYLPTGEQFAAAVSRFAYTAQGDGRVLAYVIDFLEYGVEAAP